MAETDAYEFIPELGDYVTFVSDLHKTVSGIIIYRDGSLIRIRPLNSTAAAIDFPLDAETGQFQESLGVSEVEIHKKRGDPHFSKQLGVLPGELLEFIDMNGALMGEPMEVFDVIATDDADAIKFANGTVLNFQFMGPPPPYIRINPRAAAELAAENEGTGLEETTEELPDEAFPDIDFNLLPASMVEEIPSEERIYSDSIQREDMFVSLLTDHPISRQKDPKVMSRIYRITDLLLALKNSVIQRDESGAPLPGPTVQYTVNTLQDIVKTTGGPLGALLPVAAVKKVLYTDVERTLSYTDVELRNDSESLMNALSATNTFNQDVEEGNPFITYINSLLNATTAFTPLDTSRDNTKKIAVDQDVLRTRIPSEPVGGFPSTGPARNKDGLVPLMGSALGTIDKRSARLLSASKVRNTKTNTTFIVAQADTGATVAYVLLDNDLTLYRSPIRSNNLLWDIQRSEVGRASRQTMYNALKSRNQRIIDVDGADPLLDELVTRTQSALSFQSRGLVSVLDNLGLRNLELTGEQFAPIAASVVAGTSLWDGSYKTLRKAALARLETPSAPAIAGVATVWSEEFLKKPEVASAVAIVKGKESTLAAYDLMLANEFLKNANGTLAPYVYNLLGAGETIGTLGDAWKSESARAQRNMDNMRENAKLIQSKPEINTCVHVNELDKIRSIRDDSKRMIMLDKFLKRYSSGQKGNYVLCGNCNKDLVCKHEVLMLQEYLNPGRSAALHKSLLLEFAGPVFEGAYICKNCGQKIRELEYDTHLEFDDEGRPLMGRTVIEEEVDEDVGMEEEMDAAIPFKGVHKKFYFHIRTLFELCGLALEIDVYKRAVRALSAYNETYVLTEEAYKASQERQLAAATKAGRKFINVPYINWQSTELVRACGALTVLELQTNPANVPIAAPGCTLARNGFPLDGLDPKTAGTGALDYVACALASIKRNDIPWNKVLWSADTDMKRRTEQSKMAILLGLAKLTAIALPGMAALTPLEGVTQEYRDLLDAARGRAATSVGLTDAALSSRADKLPAAFRPAPHLKLEESAAPIANVARYQANVEKGNISAVRDVTLTRLVDLNNMIMAQFHTSAAATGIKQANNPCSESVCCSRKLAVYEENGNGVETIGLAETVVAEARVVKEAAVVIARRDSAAPNAGTHITVPWSAPLTTNQLPASDAANYYKIFLKNCHAGRRYGATHEFNEAYVCRNCAFAFPAELIYLIPAMITEGNAKKYEAAIAAQLKERETIALAAFAAQGIVINEDSFRAMEDAIKVAKLIAPRPIIDQVYPFEVVLDSILGHLRTCDVRVVQDWTSFTTGIMKIIQESRVGPARLAPLVDYSRRCDALLVEFRNALTNHASEKGRVAGALDSLKHITEHSDSHSVITGLSTHFVVGAMQVAKGYAIKKIPARKWFPKVNRDHEEGLKKIWEVFGTVSTQTSRSIADLDEDVQPVVHKALLRFSAVLGPVLKIWQKEMRPTLGVTPDEYTQVLRWTAFSLLYSLVNPASILYGDSPSVTLTTRACAALADWITLAATAAGNATRKYNLTAEQIRHEVKTRAEKERAMFIAKMDRQEREMRKMELLKKKLKIGDWAVGSQNLFKYSADMFEFERAQRAAMGVPEFAEDITGAIDAPPEGAGDLYDFGEEEHGMEEGVQHRAEQDEDADGGGEQAGRMYNVC
jgi:hypothetical protein